MENNENQFQQVEEVKVTDQVKPFFLETANWGIFLAIVGYFFIALMVISAIFLMLSGDKISHEIMGYEHFIGAQTGPAFKAAWIFGGIFLLLYAVLFFFPVFYLHSFASKVKFAIKYGDQDTFTTGIKNLKSLFKFVGILTLISVVLTVLSLVFLLIGVAIAG